MGGGTEAFPDLGRHCQRSDCNQLDFLPFKCDGCHQNTEHTSPRVPQTRPNSRKVVVCETCSTSIETTGRDEKEEKAMLERHEKSGECDPSKKKKPICPVRRCKEQRLPSSTTGAKERWSDKFLAALGLGGERLRQEWWRTVSPPGTSHPVKAC
ncbi:Zinc finger AN1 domain-containing stress-associated protein 12 [Vitis vinifera]|uniref:Zinc finger AN1 domain-containing stress-associated protein 12 n=1 Tax=Vitis vinifera TaxID=29760 RepID=A0A438JIR4_VITVI|nr:Zinc finger AN1 domain-containing stress-associated protein 12 [Vitis vinifera]